MGIIKKAIGGILLAIVGYRVLLLLHALDVVKVAYNHEPGPCRPVVGIETGSSGIHVLPDGTSFISSGLRLSGLDESEAEKRKGWISVYDLKTATGKAQPLKIDSELFDHANFNPHGLSAWQDPKTGATYLFVINHLPSDEYVEKFQVDLATKTLKHVKSYFSPEFHHLADIVALDADRFFVSNFARYDVLTEFILQLSLGSVIYYDGSEAHNKLSGLHSPHGLAVKDKYIYISTKGDKSLQVYGIESDFNLTFAQSLYLGSSCYAIDISSASDLWLGCEPVSRLLLYGGYLANPTTGIAPSQVLKVKVLPDGKLEEKLTQVYANDGKTLSASSAAVTYGNQVFIGSLYGKMIQCEIKHV